jgi:hypothetical protein
MFERFIPIVRNLYRICHSIKKQTKRVTTCPHTPIKQQLWSLYTLRHPLSSQLKRPEMNTIYRVCQAKVHIIDKSVCTFNSTMTYP